MQVSSLIGSATNTIINAQHKAESAAQTIANASLQNDEVGGSKNISANELFKPILSLKEAEYETYAGVKLLKTQKNTLGSLLNVKA
jgi:hypothetical protein